MSLTTAFISELIKAANEADRLSPFEIKQLLNRSVAIIRDMREQTGIRGSSRCKGCSDRSSSRRRPGGHTDGG